MKVDSFRGEYSFLSNFYPAKVGYNSIVFPTVEHAYQAAKTLDPRIMNTIRQAATPGLAKKWGKTLTLRPDWDDRKLDIMYILIKQKFSHEPLKSRLLKTGDAELIEGNRWHDTYWGVCNSVGENHLGRVIMRVRDELRKEQHVIQS